MITNMKTVSILCLLLFISTNLLAGLKFSDGYSPKKPAQEVNNENYGGTAGLKINHSLDSTGEGRKTIISDYEKMVLSCKPIINTRKSVITTGKISCDDGNTYVIESSASDHSSANTGVYNRTRLPSIPKTRTSTPCETDSSKCLKPSSSTGRK